MIKLKRWKQTAIHLFCIMGFMLVSFCESFPIRQVRAEDAGNPAVRAEETQAETAESEEIKPSELYARSAVLMDAETGRILFAKSGQEPMPMASTTKILTCILTLEQGKLSDRVEVSNEAAAQPEVRLGMRSGQQFYLKDLLYSLMLESHNDSAVAIAEHIGGSVQGFADMMNEKARELECRDTYFITPNGLDAQDENGIHHTTAADLARIMRYCIMESAKKEEFLEITRTETHSFSDCDGNGSYGCTNHNAFLRMMEGALTGKTGFTSDAGYCYVGALRRDDRTFIVALLACGWPNNKGYKWSDTRKLMEYALGNYFYEEITPELPVDTVDVKGGFTGGFPQKEPVKVRLRTGGGMRRILLKRSEQIKAETHLPEEISAPAENGERVGEIVYTADGEIVAYYPVFLAESAEERNLKVCLSYMLRSFLN